MDPALISEFGLAAVVQVKSVRSTYVSLQDPTFLLTIIQTFAAQSLVSCPGSRLLIYLSRSRLGIEMS
jgi:hypothetical protein